MIFNPPDVPYTPGIQPELADFLRRLTMWASKQFTYKVPTDTAVAELLLQSSGGKVYKVTVDDAGAIHATLVPLGSHY